MPATADDELWETNQTIIAAFMIYNGFEVADCLWDGRHCSFLFQKDSRIQELLMEFVSGEARVEPSSFNTSFAKAKRIMYAHPDAPPRRSDS